MILLPYLLSAVYGVVLSRRASAGHAAAAPRDLPVAALAAVYGVWLLYAAGFKYLLLAAVLYVPGAAVYRWARRERKLPVFTARERGLFLVLLLLAVGAVVGLSTGRLSL
jgi:arginine:ornithine antiporter/lysine permease